MDWGTVLSWLFGIVSTLLGGLNIFQWITLKSYKRVKEAEADRMEIENMQLVIKSMGEEIRRLHEQYNDLQKEFESYKQQHK